MVDSGPDLHFAWHRPTHKRATIEEVQSCILINAQNIKQYSAQGVIMIRVCPPVDWTLLAAINSNNYTNKRTIHKSYTKAKDKKFKTCAAVVWDSDSFQNTILLVHPYFLHHTEFTSRTSLGASTKHTHTGVNNLHMKANE